MSVELDVPRILPVDSFSASSIGTYLRCPDKWRRRYVEREYEQPSAAMVLGSSVGAAEAQADYTQMNTGQRPGSDVTTDSFSDEWEERVEREEVQWNGKTPGEMKDTGLAVVKAYDEQIGPHVKPISVEREFNLAFDGVDWGYRGFLDLEEADGAVVDRKVRGSKLGKADADSDLQATSYLLARRAEANPASVFRFHVAVKTKVPYAEIVPTTRTDRQLDSFVDRLYRIAAEIQWRLENDNWGFSIPGAYWCGPRSCGYWDSCPAGGAR